MLDGGHLMSDKDLEDNEANIPLELYNEKKKKTQAYRKPLKLQTCWWSNPHQLTTIIGNARYMIFELYDIDMMRTFSTISFTALFLT